MSTPSTCFGSRREAPRASHNGTVMLADGVPRSKTSNLMAVARRVLAVVLGVLRLGWVSAVLPAGSGAGCAIATASATVPVNAAAISNLLVISQVLQFKHFLTQTVCRRRPLPGSFNQASVLVALDQYRLSPGF